MADPTIIEAIMKAVPIPVMAKCRVGLHHKRGYFSPSTALTNTDVCVILLLIPALSSFNNRDEMEVREQCNPASHGLERLR